MDDENIPAHNGEEFAYWITDLIEEGAQNNDNARVIQELEQNPELINLSSPTTGTLLHTAACTGNVTIVQTLVALGANVDSVEGLEITPLKLAVLMQSFAGVHALIQSGANIGFPVVLDVGARLDFQEIFEISYNSPLLLAFADSEFFDPFVVRVFINHFHATLPPGVPAIPALATAVIEAGGSLVHAACWGDIELLQVISQHPNHSDLNKRGPTGRTAFFVAVETNNLALAYYLIDQGVNVQLGSDQEASTTLHWASRHGSLELVKTLIANGAATEQIGGREIPSVSDDVSAESKQAWIRFYARHQNHLEPR